MSRVKALRALGAAACALGLMLAGSLNIAQVHADERVSITNLRPDGSQLHVAWAAQEAFAYYIVAWDTHGAGSFSQKVGGDQFVFDIPNDHPGANFTVSVLGCLAATPWYVDSPCVASDHRDITT
jgi:hypothetical protein